MEALGGTERIPQLNYNALRVMQDPLYAKLGQQLRDDNTALNNGILDQEE